MKLTITLTPFEESNIHGWLNDLIAHPQYIGKTKADGLPPRPDGIMPWQTRIVLESQTRERFEEIAKQFGVVVTPPVEPPVASADFCDLDKDIRWPIQWGDSTRRETRTVGDFRYNNVCLAFTVPRDIGGPFAQAGDISLSEFDGDPTMRHMTISRHACDFRPVDPTGVNGPLFETYGKQATAYFNAVSASGGAVAVQPGQGYFVNIRNWSKDTNDHNVLPPESGTSYDAGVSINWPRN